jgi:outer membrane protein TolC
VPTVPDRPSTIEAVLKEAYVKREDFLAAEEEVRAAEARRSAALAAHLPSVRVNADYGAIGLTAGTALPTYNVTGSIDVPIFDGGRTRAKIAQANADLKRKTAQLEDLKASVYYDVRSAFLDLEATRQQMEAATRGRELATQQLQQSRDRFAAGVSSNIEVIQAQEAVAVATEQAISAEYGFSVSKTLLAAALGNAEETLLKAVQGGLKP